MRSDTLMNVNLLHSWKELRTTPHQPPLQTRQKLWAQARRRIQGRAHVLQPALVLPKALWQGSQGVALAEELIQARQACKLVRQPRQGHAAHIQELELLQRADVARDLLDGVLAAENTHLSVEDVPLALAFRVRSYLAPGPRACYSRPGTFSWCSVLICPGNSTIGFVAAWKHG